MAGRLSSAQRKGLWLIYALVIVLLIGATAMGYVVLANQPIDRVRLTSQAPMVIDVTFEAVSPLVVNVNEPFEVSARVCGVSYSCVAPTDKDGKIQPGSLVRTRLKASGLEVEPLGDDTQRLDIKPSEAAVWVWRITAHEPGNYMIYIWTVALAEDKTPLGREELLRRPLAVGSTPSYALSRTGRQAASTLTTVGAILSGLGVTVPMIVSWVRATRRHRLPTRDSRGRP